MKERKNKVKNRLILIVSNFKHIYNPKINKYYN